MHIRHANANDLDQIAKIEALSYPFAEGASKESIQNRISVFPECFWILEDKDQILAFINGMLTNERNLSDAMYDHAEKHDPNGKWLMIFSVVTDPAYRNKGYASQIMTQLIQDSRQRQLTGIVLTCKEKLLPFYSRFGFMNEGISNSTHGNAVWYQMRLEF